MHVVGAFNWPVAEACCAQQFFPDTISTDMHTVRYLLLTCFFFLPLKIGTPKFWGKKKYAQKKDDHERPSLRPADGHDKVLAFRNALEGRGQGDDVSSGRAMCVCESVKI